jgi:hypothetical protein
MREFVSSRPSQPFWRLAIPEKRENGPEILAFRAFDFVSGLSRLPPEGLDDMHVQGMSGRNESRASTILV